ncbi:MAG: hypothetical protein KIT73_16140, partial [Burkholderiales bacterium]|nr:hypothetical protein [Burkholderiales bacterium]
MGKSLVRAIAVAIALGVWSAVSLAAGLGKLTVISSLGQPFRAEIDLVAVKKDELSSLAVRMASPDAFRQAELPFTAYVSNMKLAIETRPNGDSYVKVSSYQPLDEPFIDFLVELNWTSGRLVRAYTALVDPPVVTDAEVATTAPTPPAPAPVVVPVPTEPAPVAVAPVPEPMPVAPSAPRAPAPATPPPAADRGGPGSIVVPDHDDAADHDDVPAPVAENSEVVTKKGDTLSKIAKDHKPEDVSLEQMLVLLYRDNPDAFSGKNMNRLKTGKILQMPSADEYASLSAADAHQEVVAQARDWNAYRDQL